MTFPFMPVVDTEIFKLRPDYSAISVLADGIANVDRHPAVDRYVEETVARATRPPWTDGHLEAWRATDDLPGALVTRVGEPA